MIKSPGFVDFAIYLEIFTFLAYMAPIDIRPDDLALRFLRLSDDFSKHREFMPRCVKRSGLNFYV